MKSFRILFGCCSGILVMIAASLAQAQDWQPFFPDKGVEFEHLPILRASEILLPEFLRGTNFAVREAVPTSAGRNQYVIDSSFGVFEAIGNEKLIEQVTAIHAIARLNAVSRTEQYTKALQQAAQSPVKFVESLAKNPVGTVTGVPKGIRKMINRTGDSIRNLGEPHERNPYEDSMGMSLIGFSKAKREIARQLRIDPYSSNEVLQKQLNGIAWAAFGGNATFSAALTPVGGVTGIAITAVNVADATTDTLYDTSPDDLRSANLEKLLKLGVRREIAEAFLNSSAYSPTRATGVVNSLESLRGVAGLTDYLAYACEAKDEVNAIFYQRTARLLAKINGDTPLLEVRFALGLPVCLAEGGTAIVALEWDYLAWTPNAARFVQMLKGSPSGKTPIHFTDGQNQSRTAWNRDRGSRFARSIEIRFDRKERFAAGLSNGGPVIRIVSAAVLGSSGRTILIGFSHDFERQRYGAKHADGSQYCAGGFSLRLVQVTRNKECKSCSEDAAGCSDQDQFRNG